MDPPPGQFLTPIRVLATHAETLMAGVGIESQATATSSEIVIDCAALPCRPTQLLAVGGGLASISRAHRMRVNVPEGPAVNIPLGELPQTSPTPAESAFIRYQLLAEWSSPPLSRAQSGDAVDGDLTFVMASIIYALLQEANAASGGNTRSTLTELGIVCNGMIDIVTKVKSQTPRLKRFTIVAKELGSDCTRALNATKGHPQVPNGTGLLTLLLELQEHHLVPTRFMGEI